MAEPECQAQVVEPVVVPDVVPEVLPEVVPLVVVPDVVPLVDMPPVLPEVLPLVDMPLVVPEVEPLVEPAFSEAVQALNMPSDALRSRPARAKERLFFMGFGEKRMRNSLRELAWLYGGCRREKCVFDRG